jgi:hypothetical protein
MTILFIVLTVLSLAALVAGMAWALATSGETRRRSGPDVGAEIIADRMEDEHDEATTIAQRTAFKGKAVKVEREASFGLADVKHQVAAGQWREALPVLLALGGLVGFLLFGSLVALLAIESKLIGGAIVIVAAYAVVRIVLALRRA